MCAIAARALLAVASMLLRLSAVSCLRAILALAMLLPSSKLTWRTTVLLLATVAAVLLRGRGRTVAMLALSAAAVLATWLV